MALKDVFLGMFKKSYNDTDRYTDDGSLVRGLRAHTARVDSAPVAGTDVVRLSDISAIINMGLAVTSIDSPTELTALAGKVQGDLILAMQLVVSGPNLATLYMFDTSGPAADGKFVVNGTGGVWVAKAGYATAGRMKVQTAPSASDDVVRKQELDAVMTRVLVDTLSDPSPELGLLTGVNGGLLFAYDDKAAENSGTLYMFDTAISGGTLGSPYVVSGSGGKWIAVSGLASIGGFILDLTVTRGAIINDSAGATGDLQVKGASDANLFFVDFSTDRIGVGTNSPSVQFQVTKSAIFNSSQGDNDFRVDGQGFTGVLFIDASTQRVGINNLTPGATLDVVGLHQFAGNIVPEADMTRSVGVTAKQLQKVWTRDLSADGPLNLIVRAAGTAGDLTLNSGGADVDTKIKGAASLLIVHVDGGTGRVGILNVAPTTELDVTGTITATAFAGKNVIGYGLLAARPAASTAGKFYLASDNSILYYDNGSAWTAVSFTTRKVSVATIGTPDSELGGLTGVEGEMLIAYQSGNPNINTLYIWEASATTNSPYIVAGSSGAWVANGGRYSAQSLSVNGALTVIGAVNFQSATRTDFDAGVLINDSGLDSDTKIQGDNDPNLIYADASTDRVGIGTSTPTDKLHVSGSVSLDGACVINETGAAVNTRVESDGDANKLFIDGTNNRVGIGTNAPDYDLHIKKTGAGLALKVEFASNALTTPDIQFKANPTSGGAIQEDSYFVRQTTTDGVARAAWSLATANDSWIRVIIEVLAFRTAGAAGAAGDGAGYTATATFKNVAGTLTQIGSTQLVVDGESQAGWACELIVSGANIVWRVTGATNNDVTWQAKARVYSASS